MASIYNMPDADLLALLNAMIATISGDLASYPGITAAMVTDAGTIRDDYSDKLQTHVQTQAASLAATTAKDAARTQAIKEIIVKFRKTLDANGVAEDKYDALGIPVAESNIPANATVPVGMVDTSERLRHTIRWVDAATPGNKRRPRGAIGAEIWRKIDGPLPGSELDCEFLTLDTETPYLVEYPAEHAGKTVHYLFRWQLKDGSKSAFGETISATVTG